MGIDKKRFFSNVENFVCGICSNVALDPVLINGCEHYLCRLCVPAHLEKCPTCGSSFTAYHEIGPALKRVYLEIKLKCSYISCLDELTIGNYALHEQTCSKGVYQCQNSCGFKAHISLVEEVQTHNCISYLIKQTERLNHKIYQLKKVNCGLQKENNELNRKVELLEANNDLLKTTTNNNNKRRARCAIIIQKGEKFYRCYTCQIRRISAMCVDCFEDGKHINHRYVFVEAENDRNYCDCGDTQTLDKEATCSQHQL